MTEKLSHVAWARSMVSFIRDSGLERDFEGYCGGWPCRVASLDDKPKRFDDWHEGHGDVLWFKHPISEPPYFGSPVCLGRTMVVEIMIGREHFELPAQQTGGWPFDCTEERDLWWMPGPNGNAVQAAIDAAIGREVGDG